MELARIELTSNIMSNAVVEYFVAAVLLGAIPLVAVALILGPFYCVRFFHRKTKGSFWKLGSGLGVVFSVLGFGYALIRNESLNLAIPEFIVYLLPVIEIVLSLTFLIGVPLCFAVQQKNGIATTFFGTWRRTLLTFLLYLAFGSFSGATLAVLTMMILLGFTTLIWSGLNLAYEFGTRYKAAR